MKKYITILLSIVLYLTSNAQENNKINIHFEAKQFDKLNLIIVLPEIQADGKRNKESIAGISDNGTDWVFNFPDRFYNKHLYTRIEVPAISDTLEELIGFININGNDTLLAGDYCFSRGVSDIKAVYVGANPFQKLYVDPITHIGHFKTAIQDVFLISAPSDNQLLASIEAMGSGYNRPAILDSIAYQKQLNQYEDLTKKYPNSHFLCRDLSSNLNAYKSKTDIQRIFDCFSPEIKQSYYGLKISDFLDSRDTQFDHTTFENSILPVWNSAKTEPIVQDTSRYNLIIFSASWCRPCHALIPELKKIYTNYKDQLILTYVSMDEERTLKDWSTIIRNENIPWRSLLAKDNLKIIQNKYCARGIPQMILVYPRGKKAEILDIRMDKDYKKLIELMKL